MSDNGSPSANASKPRRRFIGTKSKKPLSSAAPVQIRNQIPQEILEDVELNEAIKLLPSNYSFEIHKTIWHIRKNESKMVGLQMPEGLQMFACVISDIIERFTDALTTILGDVTYGACCVDDYTAVALGCDLLVHYGHSCLVPMDQTTIKTLYVFVEISIDSDHLHHTIRRNFPDDRDLFRESLLGSEDEQRKLPAGTQISTVTPHLRIEGPTSDSNPSPVEQPMSRTSQPTRLALVSTIQFVAALQRLKEDLSDSLLPETTASSSASALWSGEYSCTIPRSKPLSPGEILGCTAPGLGEDVDAIIYLGDGRFHLESIMIANPSVPAFRYDPYSKKLTWERYEHTEMRRIRGDAIRKAKGSIDYQAPARNKEDERPLWGVILGTLGRQGSFRQLRAITHQLASSRTPIPYIPILLSELSPAKLALFNNLASSRKSVEPNVTTWIQTSCPRLSIDWGYAFDRPLLSPYEAALAIGGGGFETGWLEELEGSTKHTNRSDKAYPMDFYAAATPWAVSRTRARFND
ncbi:diphthamide biosynthesis protein 1 [Moniliophthora roreri MCA 2997]|uniref:2-(3-amino-3-carboxypropyl)histidine synthase subunit 1 n=1 Tax=Moniliophthora roreri (strain MCA 2997) TaxID=1381753 RepID=V2XUL8_MONRO|nr:diphthamide biosynthesis protein 1 [Moniliophthora roreri MCA 2997]